MGTVSPQLYCPQPFHSRISRRTQTSPPVLRLPYITWSQSYFTVFIILHFMCFPPPQIIVFLHPPHSASDYLSPFSSSVVHNQWPHQSPHRSTLSRLLICAKGGRDGGREGGGRLAGYTRTSDGLSAPSSSHNSDLSPPPRPSFSLFRVDPWRTELGGREEVVFQRRCAGQPAFIRMNQRGDKISPVTKQGYEIRALIEFSSPGRGCGALNIIEFDRLMKRAPVLVLPLSTGRGEREKKSRPLLPHAYVRMLMFKHVRPPKVDVAKHGGLFFFRISTIVCSQCSTLLYSGMRRQRNINKK